MANPNIVQVTNIQGNSAGYGITTSNGIFIGAVPSDKVFKLLSAGIFIIHLMSFASELPIIFLKN